MSIERNKEVARRFVEEVVNAQDMGPADELVSADYVLYFPGCRRPILRSDLPAFLEELRNGFPDFKMKVEQILADDDSAVVVAVFTGTNKGTYQGLRATGREVALPACVLLHIVDGKIREDRVLFDQMELLLQMGIWEGAPVR